jgi:hypothetical protein
MDIEEVVTDAAITPDELADLNEAFRRFGFDVQAEPAIHARSIDPVPWVVYITLGAPIATFFTTLAAEAGKDAYEPLKELVKGVLAARRNRPGYAAISDPEHSRVTLQPGLPEEALDALKEIDWSEMGAGDLHWSRARREWLDPLRTPEAF